MLPLVSIIVPVYNVEKYLQQCVDSLVSQTYKNIEILLIDDGSKDNSGQMCNQFSEQYTNVMSFHKKNSGLGLTRNFGLERINGDYVTFVDSDDYLRQDAIQKLVDGLGDGQNDTVIGGFTKITDDGKELYIETYPEEVINNGLVYSRLFNRMLGSSPDRHDSIKPSVWNTLYSVKIIQEHNLHFVSERELISEDIVWDSDYYRYSQSAKIISEPTYYYRYNPNSLSQAYNPDRFEKSIYFFEYMAEKLRGSDIAEEGKLRLTKYLFVCVRSAFSQSAVMPFRESRKSIKAMCNSKELRQAIDEYPINKLKFKQRMFVIMIRYEWISCLTILAKKKLM